MRMAHALLRFVANFSRNCRRPPSFRVASQFSSDFFLSVRERKIETMSASSSSLSSSSLIGTRTRSLVDVVGSLLVWEEEEKEKGKKSATSRRGYHFPGTREEEDGKEEEEDIMSILRGLKTMAEIEGTKRCEPFHFMIDSLSKTSRKRGWPSSMPTKGQKKKMDDGAAKNERGFTLIDYLDTNDRRRAISSFSKIVVDRVLAELEGCQEREGRRWKAPPVAEETVASSKGYKEDDVASCLRETARLIKERTVRESNRNNSASVQSWRHRILSIRLLVTPPGCPPQDWHLDYRSHDRAWKSETVFVSLTNCDESNCTEYLVLKDQDAFERKVWKSLSKRREETDDRGGQQPTTLAGEGESFSASPTKATRIVVRAEDIQCKRSVATRAFDVVHMHTSKLPHRRGPSHKSTYTRVVLNIDFVRESADEAREIADAADGEGRAVRSFVDSDWFDALENDGVVGQSVVDNLHSEVVLHISDALPRQEERGKVPTYT